MGRMTSVYIAFVPGVKVTVIVWPQLSATEGTREQSNEIVTCSATVSERATEAELVVDRKLNMAVALGPALPVPFTITKVGCGRPTVDATPPEVSVLNETVTVRPTSVELGLTDRIVTLAAGSTAMTAP